MNARERFQAVMHFEKSDFVPLYNIEGITEQAVRQWCKKESFPIGMRAEDYFNFDRDEVIALDEGPIPSFIPRTIEENGKWRTTIDRYGFKVRSSKDSIISPTTYYYLEGSVRNRDEWENMKKRYNPHDIRRYPKYWGKEFFEYCQDADHPIKLWIHWGPGRAIKNGYMMGLKRFLESLSSKSDLFHDMFSFWADFIIELIKEVVQRGKIDYAFIVEDGLGYKNSSIISPQTYREFWFPSVKKVIDFLKSHGIDIVGFYSSGNIKPLMPVMLEAGFNLFAPLEYAAGMDAVELRKEYGKKVLLMGNISREALMKDKEAIRRDVLGKVPYLIRQGGYIPSLDDMVLPDISLENYTYYINLIRSLL